jgi:Mor family transcriptional regulator
VSAGAGDLVDALLKKPVSNYRIPKADRNQQIIACFEHGDTLAEIARDFHISINRVHQIIKRWG